MGRKVNRVKTVFCVEKDSIGGMIGRSVGVSITNENMFSFLRKVPPSTVPVCQ